MKGNMKKKLMCSLLVKNYDEAIDFYTKKLGWVVAEDNPMGDDRWVTITVPGNDGCVVALHVARTKEDLTLLGKQGGSYPYFGMETHDCLGDYKRMKKLGVKFHGEPEVRPYGTGVMLEDLYGNQIFMNQEPIQVGK
jgi:catechol 2,3-dioxygenase-like lactoylglutathione lyase family enzyme